MKKIIVIDRCWICPYMKHNITDIVCLKLEKYIHKDDSDIINGIHKDCPLENYTIIKERRDDL